MSARLRLSVGEGSSSARSACRSGREAALDIVEPAQIDRLAESRSRSDTCPCSHWSSTTQFADILDDQLQQVNQRARSSVLSSATNCKR
ncbi:MAG: hypothetical protein IPG52_15720 [Rhodocyclaceae bacterium]|nr:hypothetical protein [Rhodocyclaceae bacterium]